MSKPVAYVGTKIVWGKPMTENEFLASQNKDLKPVDRQGYEVTYDDGYVSWSPMEVFERCYRPLTGKERAMIPHETTED